MKNVVKLQWNVVNLQWEHKWTFMWQQQYKYNKYNEPETVMAVTVTSVMLGVQKYPPKSYRHVLWQTTRDGIPVIGPEF